MRYSSIHRTLANTQQGFSLIESLVALAIFATSVVIGLNTLSNGLKQLTMLEDRHLASSLANNLAHQWYLFESSKIPATVNTEFANRHWKIINSQETIQQTSLTKLTINVYADLETTIPRAKTVKVASAEEKFISAPLHTLTLILKRPL